jgi:hypothetical protein
VVTTKGTNYVGSSASVPVRVLHWSDVGSIDTFYYTHPISGDVSFDPIGSAGVSYAHPLSLDAGCYNQWGGSAWVDYVLDRQYETFAATVGIGDGAPTADTATYKIIGGNGVKLATGSLVVGKSTKLRLALSGVYRLRLWINVPDPNGAAGCSSSFTKVVFGDAQLLGP